jgi:spermidine synthase
VVEIDPEVIRVAEQYFGVDPTNPRLHIYNEDGRIFLQQTTQKYDLVILDAYSKSYVPFHLMTLEFFELLADHLAVNGAVISNLITSISGGSSQLLGAEINTMHSVFPNVYAFATEGAEYPDVQNIIILDTLSARALTEVDFQQLATTSNTSHVPLLEDVSNFFVMPANKAPVLTDNFAPVDTLLNPMTGQPLSEEDSGMYVQEVEQIIAVVAILAVVLLVLHRKKVF